MAESIKYWHIGISDNWQIEKAMNKDWSIDIANEGSLVRGTDDILQCFYIILHTIPGSDPLRPDFGSDIYQYLDKPVNQFSGKLSAQIKNDLEKWEPRVSI